MNTDDRRTTDLTLLVHFENFSSAIIKHFQHIVLNL